MSALGPEPSRTVRAGEPLAPVDRGTVAAAVAALGELAKPGLALGPLTTYRVGGSAAVGVTVRGLADLARVAEAVRASGLPVLVVGNGSNLLVADRGFPGIAVVLDADSFGWLDIADTTVRAGAAALLPVLARRTVEAGLTGLEWAVGVPGSVGGGVRMNAGGHGSDMAGTLVGCEVVALAEPGAQPGVVRLGLAQLALGYRSSSIGPADVVVSAEFRLGEGDREAGRETIRQIVRWRREHQPGGQNAGSVFTNPSASSFVQRADDDEQADPAERAAGWLVDAAGLKGFRIGTASVSTKHANFIQADPNGSADDVRAVMLAVARRVEEQWGVVLRTEIRLVGFDELSCSTGA